MKTKDIKVGEDYAYFDHKYASGKRVTVVETGIEQKQGYSRRIVKSGVKVKFVGGNRDGNMVVVTARQIERPWAEQERLNQAALEARRAREDSARQTATRRANLARRLEDRLEAHGVSRHFSSYSTFGDATTKAALRAHHFPETDAPYGGRGFVTRITNLDDLMRHGRVSEKDVEVLLADVEAVGR